MLRGAFRCLIPINPARVNQKMCRLEYLQRDLPVGEGAAALAVRFLANVVVADIKRLVSLPPMRRVLPEHPSPHFISRL
jgi:hypothetical protein